MFPEQYDMSLDLVIICRARFLELGKFQSSARGIPVPPARHVTVRLNRKVLVEGGTQSAHSFNKVTFTVTDSVEGLPPEIFIIFSVVGIDFFEVIGQTADG